MDALVHSLQVWLKTTQLYYIMNNVNWAWRTSESIHFIGLCPFLAGASDQYIYNPAFQMKMLFMGTAGLNVAVFYLATYRRVAATAPADEAPFRARIAGGVSLLCWVGVIFCGRFLTFYRPPWHWCPWC